MASRSRKSSPSERGSVLVEAAVVIPKLLFLMIGVMDFGLAYWNLSTAQTSLRNTARYLSKLPASQLCAALATDAKNLAVYGKTTPSVSDKPLVSGWSDTGISNITIVVKEGTSYNSAETVGCTSGQPAFRRIQISATVPYKAIAWTALFLPGSIVMNAKHEERWIGQ